MLAGHSRFDAETNHVGLRTHNAGAQRCFKIGFEFLDFVRSKLVHRKQEFARRDVLPLYVEVGLASDFVVPPRDLKKFVNAQWMLTAKD